MAAGDSSSTLGDFLSGAESLYTTYTAADLANQQVQGALAQSQAQAALAQAQQQNTINSQNLQKQIMTYGLILLGVLVVVWIVQKFFGK